MGTRHLIAVQLDGEYKIAQYGQWDGYPEGQGVNVLHFLRDQMNEGEFKRALHSAYYISDEKLNALWKECGADKSGFVSVEGADSMRHDHPQFSRDTGADILPLVQRHPEGIELQDSLSFAANGLFCEWIWVIDFDKRTFEGYEGFSRERLASDERFYKFDTEEGYGDYHPPRLVVSFSLDNLPDNETFLASFVDEEELS